MNLQQPAFRASKIIWEDIGNSTFNICVGVWVGRLIRVVGVWCEDAQKIQHFNTNIVIGTHREQNLRINNLSKNALIRKVITILGPRIQPRYNNSILWLILFRFVSFLTTLNSFNNQFFCPTELHFEIKSVKFKWLSGSNLSREYILYIL